MVHDTSARMKAREMRKVAKELEAQAQTLASIPETKGIGANKAARARKLNKKASELNKNARLEDLTVRQAPIEKRNKKGETKTYYRWVCSWRDGDKTITKYLGSVKKISQEEALQKARKMKAQALGFSSLNIFFSP